MIIYVAGPMSGLPEHNYPAFDAAAAALADLGFEVLNPVDVELVNPTPGVHQSWQWYMREAIRMVSRADALAFLPGWHSSRGARLEHRIGAGLRLPMRDLASWLSDPQNTVGDDLTDIDPDELTGRTEAVTAAINKVRDRHRLTIEQVLLRRSGATT